MTEQDATKVQIPGEFNDDADFWPHEICNNYEANREGIVRNKFTKNQVGYRDKRGYYQFTCSGNCCRGEQKKKHHRLHRFVYESFYGLIEHDKVIDHIDNDPLNNRLENLQMISKSENSKKDYKKCDNKAIKIRAINVKTGETFIYKSIYGASKDLKIHRGSISYVLSGMTKTALSKKYNERYYFQKMDKNSEITSTVIIINNKKNININHVRKMIVNNSS